MKKSQPKNPDDDLPAVQNATAKPFVRERAYYEPDEEDDLLLEEEEDSIPDFAARRRKQKEEEEETDEPPPIPSRSGDNKSAMMLKLMKNATNIMRS